MKKIKLDPKAYLSPVWSRNFDNKDFFQNYLNMIDGSNGLELIKKCKSASNCYVEVISNELYLIKDYIVHELLSINEKELIVIIGACKSLIAMELLKNFPAKLTAL